MYYFNYRRLLIKEKDPPYFYNEKDKDIVTFNYSNINTGNNNRGNSYRAPDIIRKEVYKLFEENNGNSNRINEFVDYYGRKDKEDDKPADNKVDKGFLKDYLGRPTLITFCIIVIIIINSGYNVILVFNK
ncbi:hypothetical protein B0T20DRAFT_396792 [Sordaria brevicollis]|uniref:Uncharacterized protein n=1 Tax=Sordaria brevicollis TaxID=83679 RepID=A0AAE0P2J0_SORBR|nr:hypothetical protein B0T20DRAFT_396792 [Sordaria brevicollis]